MICPDLIPKLLEDLVRIPSSTKVSNPYHDTSRLKNLEAYLNALCVSGWYSGHLFVGEAPGYKGCAITGIPFTSERVLRSGAHPFLSGLLPSLTLSGDVTERSATIVWNVVSKRKSVPGFWNAFPFHPINDPPTRNPNRAPTQAEIAVGRPFLDSVVKILAPHTIVAVGNIASRTTASAFPNLPQNVVSHPSFGGAAKFASGFAALGIV